MSDIDKANFHATRAKGIGGSDIAVVMGISPWKTPYQLWLEKTGRVTPPDIGHLPHVKRGVENEPIARKLLNERYGLDLKPIFWHDKAKPYHRCSCDGTDVEQDIMCEIKVMGWEKHQETHKGKVPPFYYSQVQWNMYVAKMNKCLFASYNPEENDLAVVEYEPNLSFIADMIAYADNFWLEYVEKDVAPPLTEKDYVDKSGDKEYEILAVKYHDYKAKMAELEEMLGEVEAGLKQYVRDGTHGVKGFGLQISAHERRGSVDYKSIPELKEIDLDKYRKPSKLVETIRRVKG